MNPHSEDELVVLVSSAGSTSAVKTPATNGAKRGRSNNNGNNNKKSDAGPALQVLGLRSGVSRATYLRGTSVAGGLCVVPTHEGPVLLSSQRDTRFVHAWHAGKEAVDLRCAMPERVGPLAASRDGAFLVAGASTGKCLVWDLHTGELLRIWEAHLRGVTSIKFTDDDSVFVTASEDASVHVWDLGQVVGGAASATDGSSTGRVTPLVKWNGHSLPVTDVHIGVGSGMEARVVSCSLDHTCRVWSLASRSLVGTLTFPSQLSAVTMDTLETLLFAGSADGRIFCNLLQDDAASSTSVSRTSSQQQHQQQQQGAHDAWSSKVLEGHRGRVTGLHVVAGNGQLVSCAEDGGVRVWDIRSGQCARTIDTACSGGVASMLVMPRSGVTAPWAKRQGDRSRSTASGLCMKPLSKFVVRDQDDEDDKTKVSHQVMGLRQKDTNVGKQQGRGEWPWALGAGPNVGAVGGASAGGVQGFGGVVSMQVRGEEEEEDENEELKEMASENKRLMEECAALKQSSAQWEQVAGRLAKLARVKVATE